MTLPEGLTVVESPKQMLLGTSRAWAIDFSNLGSPAAIGDTVAFDEDGGDANAMLSGVAQQAGPIITLEEFEPTSAGKFRIVHQVSIGAQTVFGLLDVEVFAVVPPTAGVKTIATGSYSSISSVGSLVPRYATRTGTFDDTTRPVVQVVVEHIDSISAIVDSMLATEGFLVPVTHAQMKRALDFFVAQEVAAVIEGINGSGRFGPSTKRSGNKGRMAVIYDDVQNFIETNSLGWERMGAERTHSYAGGIAFRGQDEAGDTVFPIRQRKEYDTNWKDWDR